MKQYLVITGGSRGIGKQTIAKFLHEGWQAVNLSRTACDIANVKNIYFDLSKPETVGDLTANLELYLKGADKICLVHNGAIYKRDSVQSIQLSNLKNTLTTNVITAAVLNQAILPFMKKDSAIVYIGSTLAEKGVPGSASYIISKHAVIGMMRATAQDLADQGITSCCICPGLVETNMLRENIDQQTVNAIVEQSVLGKRLIRADEMADVIYYCGINPLFNGSVLHANLGQQMS